MLESGYYIPAPKPFRPAPFVLCPACPEAIGQLMRGFTQAAVADATWPTANLGIGYPFQLTQARTALQMYSWNGATAAGTRDLGIYDAAGNLIVSIGSTAASGTSALQLYNITDTGLNPFTTYYCWMAASTNTDTFNRWAAGTNVGQMGAAGLVEAGSSFALPSTITAAAFTANYLPVFGISFVSVI